VSWTSAAKRGGGPNIWRKAGFIEALGPSDAIFAADKVLSG